MGRDSIMDKILVSFSFKIPSNTLRRFGIADNLKRRKSISTRMLLCHREGEYIN